MPPRLCLCTVSTCGSSPEEFVAYLKADMERWARVAQAAKVKLD